MDNDVSLKFLSAFNLLGSLWDKKATEKLAIDVGPQGVYDELAICGYWWKFGGWYSREYIGAIQRGKAAPIPKQKRRSRSSSARLLAEWNAISKAGR